MADDQPSRAVPFVLGVVVGLVVAAVVAGVFLLVNRSSAPATADPAAVEGTMESLGLTDCTNSAAPTEGKVFTAQNVICQAPGDDERKVSVAVVTKNFEGARADLCRDAFDGSIDEVRIVTDRSSVIAIGGKGMLAWPDDPTADQVAQALGAQVTLVKDFCAI
ncbi:MAG: hypothetical protein ACKOT0_09330 [bacterium]